MIRLDETDVAARLSALDLPALMRSVLIAVARGEAENPPRAAFTTPSGIWFGAMPAWCTGEGGALGAKLVVAIPGNAARSLPTHRAVTVAESAATWDGVVSLGGVLADVATPRDGRVTVFESLGLGVEDVAAAAAMVGH